MNKKIISTLVLLVSFASLVGCSDPDINYTVTIKEIQKNKDAFYCVYVIEHDSNNELEFPTDSFVDTCDKYQVGETITLSR